MGHVSRCMMTLHLAMGGQIRSSGNKSEVRTEKLISGICNRERKLGGFLEGK